MKYILSILLSFFFVLGVSATSYTNPDGSRVMIDRPELSIGANMIVDREIEKFLPEHPFLKAPLTDDEKGSTEDPANWEYTVNVKKVYEDESYLSLLITTYQYIGGAHGSHARLGIVIDKETNKKLSISDIFDAKRLPYRLGPVWRKDITNRLQNEVGGLLQDEKNWIREGTTDISHYQSFVLTSHMLIVYGQEYQHNAYAYGPQTLTFPLSKLQDLRK